jgi:hypothetical protein
MTQPFELYEELCKTIQDFTDCIVHENRVISSYDFDSIKAVLPVKENMCKKYETVLQNFLSKNILSTLESAEKEKVLELSKTLSESMTENIKLIDYAIHYNQTIIQLFIDTSKKLKTRSYNKSGFETAVDTNHVMSFDQNF